MSQPDMIGRDTEEKSSSSLSEKSCAENTSKYEWKKFKPTKLLASGAFSNVYELEVNGYLCVCKIPHKHPEFIQTEFEIYQTLYPPPPGSFVANFNCSLFDLWQHRWRRYHHVAPEFTPYLIAYDEVISPNTYYEEAPIYTKALILPRYGSNLREIKRKRDRRIRETRNEIKMNLSFTAKCLVSIALDIIDQLQNMHTKGLVHRDLKPDNLVTGYTYKGRLCVFLIDFGLTTTYRDDKGNIKPHKNRILVNKKSGEVIPVPGTLRFAGAHVMECRHACPLDDFQGLAYTLAWLNNVRLPWTKRSVTQMNELDKIREIASMKKALHHIDELDPCLAWFYEDVMNLNHFDIPNYAKYKERFNTILYKETGSYNRVYDW